MVTAPPLIRAIDAEPAVAFVLDRSLAIVHVNPAWTDVAARDGVQVLEPPALIGRHYLDFVVGPVRRYLEEKFHQALLPSTGSRGLTLTSECNTPTLVRKLTTHVLPIRSSEQEDSTQRLILIQSLRVVGPLAERREMTEENPDLWRDRNGILLQCSCCRRAQDRRSGVWRTNSALITRGADRTSHGLCELCLEAYYPDDDPLEATGS